MKITTVTGLFYKKTYFHQYLIFYLCHPSLTRQNVPFKMSRQIFIIVVDEERRKNQDCPNLRFFLPDINITHNALNQHYVRRNKNQQLPNLDLLNNVRKATTDKPTNPNVSK